MQQGLSKFLGVKNKQEENISKFERMSKGKSKQEVRELERKLLKPEPIPVYVEEHSKFHIKKENAFKVVFSSKEDVELVKKFLHVSYYVEPSIGDMSLLIDLLKAMDSGEIIYDKKEGKFHEKCQGRKINRRDC